MTRYDLDVGELAIAVSNVLKFASPGDLSALRRMRPGHGVAAFWRLVAKYRITARQEEKWAEIVSLIALLTPTGQPGSRPELNLPERRLGTVLCDGGQGDGKVERPLLSETRLARLLAARGKTREDSLKRAVRMLARRHIQLNVEDLALAVLAPKRSAQRIARAYYKRLDRGATNNKEKTQDD